MCYAIIGIPLTMCCFAIIGNVFANIVRFVYANICCGFCNYAKKKKKQKEMASSSNGNVNEAYNSLDEISTKVVVLNEKKVNSDQYSLTNNSKMLADKFNVNKQPIPLGLYSDEIKVDDPKWFDYKNATVPLSISILILISYTFFGAAIFSYMEKWTFLEAAYFCLITLRY